MRHPFRPEARVWTTEELQADCYTELWLHSSGQPPAQGDVAGMLDVVAAVSREALPAALFECRPSAFAKRGLPTRSCIAFTRKTLNLFALLRLWQPGRTGVRFAVQAVIEFGDHRRQRIFHAPQLARKLLDAAPHDLLQARNLPFH